MGVYTELTYNSNYSHSRKTQADFLDLVPSLRLGMQYRGSASDFTKSRAFENSSGLVGLVPSLRLGMQYRGSASDFTKSRAFKNSFPYRVWEREKLEKQSMGTRKRETRK